MEAYLRFGVSGHVSNLETSFNFVTGGLDYSVHLDYLFLVPSLLDSDTIPSVHYYSFGFLTLSCLHSEINIKLNHHWTEKPRMG